MTPVPGQEANLSTEAPVLPSAAPATAIPPAAAAASAIDPTAHAAALAEAATLKARLAAMEAQQTSVQTAEATAAANAEKARIEAERDTFRGEIAQLKAAQLKSAVKAELGKFRGNPDDFMALFLAGVELGADGNLTADSVAKLAERRTQNAFLFDTAGGNTPVGSAHRAAGAEVAAQERAVLAAVGITDPDAYTKRRNFGLFGRMIGYNADAIPKHLSGGN